MHMIELVRNKIYLFYLFFFDIDLNQLKYKYIKLEFVLPQVFM